MSDEWNLFEGSNDDTKLNQSSNEDRDQQVSKMNEEEHQEGKNTQWNSMHIPMDQNETRDNMSFDQSGEYYHNYGTTGAFNPNTGTNYQAPPVTPKKPKKPKTGLKIALLLMVVIAVFFFGFGIMFLGLKEFTTSTTTNIESVEDNEELDLNNSDAKISTTTVSEGLIGQGFDVSSVVENAMPSIVQITSTVTQNYSIFGQNYSEDAKGSGSGIIVGKDKKELLVVTNNHVIDGAKTIEVTFIDNKVVKAVVKGTDSVADLAVISIQLSDIDEDSLKEIKVATLGSSDDAKVGQMAIAIGNALGYGQSVTVGYISAKNREVAVDNNTMTLLQTDAAINPGNSGGALLNVNGEVIGINSVKYASSEVEGMGYAIPISSAIPIINDLMKREVLKEEEQGYLGISCEDVREEDYNRYKMPIGVYVSGVSEDGAAKEAGIIVGDIITAVDGLETKNTQALQQKVNSTRIGTKVNLTVMRSIEGVYEEVIIPVTLKGKESLESLQENQGDTSQTPNTNEVPNDNQNPYGNQNPDDGQIPDENDSQDGFEFPFDSFPFEDLLP